MGTEKKDEVINEVVDNEVTPIEVEEKIENSTEEKVTDSTKEVKKEENNKSDKQKKNFKKESDKPESEESNKGIMALIVAGIVLIAAIFIVPFILDTKTTKTKETTKEVSNSVNITVLTDALANLKAKDTYLISTYVQAPMGNTSYVEYITPEFSATLVDDANIETAYQAQDLTQVNYRVNDVIKDGHLYFMYDNTDENGNAIVEVYQSPDNYAKECSARRYMFFDWMKDNLTDLEFVENTETDLGNGTVNMDVYKAKLSSDAVKRILGNGTYTLYKMVQDTTENEGVKKLMGWLADDIAFTLVYNDANALFGIVDGSLAYVNLEIGGLGSKMYLTKCYIEDTTVASGITLPDLTNAVAYEDLYASYGNMALEYDSMEDMYNALYYNNNNFTEEQLQEILDNAVQGAEESQGTDIDTEVILDGNGTAEKTPSEENGETTVILDGDGNVIEPTSTETEISESATEEASN